jgi:hypothetical protein
VAARLSDGSIHFGTIKDGPVGLAPWISNLFPKGPGLCGVEQPSYYQEGDALQNALRFAEMCGALKGILMAMGINAILVPPSRWMSFVDTRNERPTGKAQYRDRKKFFDRIAEERYTGKLKGKVKFSEGDSLCLLSYLEGLK